MPYRSNGILCDLKFEPPTFYYKYYSTKNIPGQVNHPITYEDIYDYNKKCCTLEGIKMDIAGSHSARTRGLSRQRI